MPHMLLIHIGAMHAPMLDPCCCCTINTPCSRSGSQLCLCCVAAFVTAQRVHTAEPLVLIPICLLMLTNYATAHLVMASLPAVHAYRLSAILAPAKRLTCLELY